MPTALNQEKKIFWNLKKTSNNAGELSLYGTVSEWSWWDDEITPRKFRDDINNLGEVEEIVVKLNSQGGDVFAGLHIYQVLKEHKAHITVRVEGLAASIASTIAMAGDKVIMPKGSMMMMHNPWTYTAGEANELRQTADVLDSIRDALVEVYVAKTGLDEEEIKSLLDSETWMTSSQAVERGFADEIEENLQISASIRGKTAVINGVEMDWSQFEDAPELPKEAGAVPSVLDKVSAVLASRPKSEPKQEPKPQPTASNELTIEALASKHPDLYAAVLAEATQKERDRIKALDELSTVPSAKAIIEKAKYETGATAEAVAVDVLKAESNRIQTIGTNRLKDAQNSGIDNLLPDDVSLQTTGDQEEQEVSGLANKFKKLRGGK
ncbi:head maturation protease, ClpP-related [Bacillus infantis]|uniref:head maturation protease, ClpP-related n=1 Tax=Bacillus infantis TaxID=324767 RepID=UPI001653567D|nr:head maturation protease, ClpP-related [Bacillus infantis]